MIFVEIPIGAKSPKKPFFFSVGFGLALKAHFARWFNNKLSLKFLARWPQPGNLLGDFAVSVPEINRVNPN